MTKTHYTGITIGPILRTILGAQKIRELWAASYIFSLLMKSILEKLPDSIEIILPDSPKDHQEKNLYGAGIWPDRCILQSSEEGTAKILEAIEEAVKEIEEKLGIDEDENLELKNYFRILAFKISKSEASSSDSNFIEIINLALDQLELSGHYQRKEERSLIQLLTSPKRLHALYKTANTKDNPVFIPYDDNRQRLPSLIEIALAELKNHDNEKVRYAYKKVQDEVGKELKKTEREEAAKNEKITENEEVTKNEEAEENDEPLKNNRFKELHETLGKDLFEKTLKFRHKYIAVVVADGDNMGEYIKNVVKDNEEKEKGRLKDVSKKLINFSARAVEKIFNYGALPIYAGGDDLFFIAPVTNYYSENAGAKNIFELCAQLNGLFKKEMETNSEHPEGAPAQKVSLSFGVSISYYKYPLGEAISDAHELLAKAKKFENGSANSNDPKVKKEAICFKVRKHSGSEFGALLHINPTSFQSALERLQESAKEEHAKNSNFLNSWIHKLIGLAPLYISALKKGNNGLKNFRENNFNEGGKHESELLEQYMQMGKTLYEEHRRITYQEAFLKTALEKIGLHSWIWTKKDKDKTLKTTGKKALSRYVIESLHAILRLEQFLTDEYEQ